jgi:hypothetical protein
MFSRAAKNLFLAALAMAFGLMLGAVTKFGFGYDSPPMLRPQKSSRKTSSDRPAASRSSGRKLSSCG